MAIHPNSPAGPPFFSWAVTRFPTQIRLRGKRLTIAVWHQSSGGWWRRRRRKAHGVIIGLLIAYKSSKQSLIKRRTHYASAQCVRPVRGVIGLPAGIVILEVIL